MRDLGWPRNPLHPTISVGITLRLPQPAGLGSLARARIRALVRFGIARKIPLTHAHRPQWELWMMWGGAGAADHCET